MSQKRLEELRELNRETFKATGEYMSEVRHVVSLAHSSADRTAAVRGVIPRLVMLIVGLVACSGGDCEVQAAALDRPQVRPRIICFPHSSVTSALQSRVASQYESQ